MSKVGFDAVMFLRQDRDKAVRQRDSARRWAVHHESTVAAVAALVSSMGLYCKCWSAAHDPCEACRLHGMLGLPEPRQQ